MPLKAKNKKAYRIREVFLGKKNGHPESLDARGRNEQLLKFCRKTHAEADGFDGVEVEIVYPIHTFTRQS
jgi:hypothetical protein